jgi:CRP-like cAMP-binding protein
MVKVSAEKRRDMAYYLIRRLEHFTRLSVEDKRALDAVASQRVRTLGSRDDLIHEGDEPQDVNLFLEGWACRYKTLEDGRRQVISYFLPGDFCDLNVFILSEMDHSIGSVTPIRVAEISRQALHEVTLNHPRVTQALWWSTLVSEAIQREWTVNLGQRDAIERVGHLLCEIFLRLRMLGLTEGDSCDFPLTQTDLAETVGLSVVHMNRTLQELRNRGLIVLRSKKLIIPDLERLQEVSLFNPNYLHLNGEGKHLDAND